MKSSFRGHKQHWYKLNLAIMAIICICLNNRTHPFCSVVTKRFIFRHFIFGGEVHTGTICGAGDQSSQLHARQTPYSLDFISGWISSQECYFFSKGSNSSLEAHLELISPLRQQRDHLDLVQTLLHYEMVKLTVFDSI